MWLAACGKVWGISKGVAVTELVSALTDSEPIVRYNAARWLPRFGVRVEAAALPLMMAARDPHPKVRRQAICALLDRQVAPPGSIARAQALGVVIRALGDSHPLVRREASKSLIAAGYGDEALPTLLRDLKDSQLKSHRSDVVWCLSRMGTKAVGAIPALRQLLQEASLDDFPSHLLRVEAASILLRLGVEGEALTVLESALQDKAPVIRKVARQTLERHKNESDRSAMPE
jgi:HEAT repeat protein